MKLIWSALQLPILKYEEINTLVEEYGIITERCVKYLEETSMLETEKEVKNSFMKLERMKLPSFNGDITEYARFKLDFERQIQPRTRDEDLA